MLKLQSVDKPDKSAWLVGDQLTVGSAINSTLVLSGLGIEPHHVTIKIDGDRVTLHPMAGDCFINGKTVETESELKSGDQLRLGLQQLAIVDSREQPKAGKQAPQPKQQKIEHWTLKPDHPKLQGKLYTVRNKLVVGRDKGCGMMLPSKLLSRQHAELEVQGSSLWVHDLDSSNGTFVDGERVEKTFLKGGETLSFAKIDFQVIAPTVKEDLDQTMVRRAIDIETIAQAKKASLEDSIAELELDRLPTDEELAEVSAAEAKAGHGRTLGLALSVVAVAVIAVSLWFLLNQG